MAQETIKIMNELFIPATIIVGVFSYLVACIVMKIEPNLANLLAISIFTAGLNSFNNYFDIPVERGYAFSAYHLYPIRVKDRFKIQKKEIFNEMRNNELGVQVHYIPVYLQPYYEKLGYKKNNCPKAEDFYEKEISIPIYPSLKDTQIKFVVKKILKIFKKL